MSINKISDVAWEREFPCGEKNDTHEIVITKEGIEIDYDFLSWEEIDKSRGIAECD